MKQRYSLWGLKYLFSALCVFFLVALFRLPARAEEYTYTVRFFAGKQGSINGGASVVVGGGGTVTADPAGDYLEISGLHYGDRLIFDRDMVALNDGSKYYIRGIRESGKDNNTVVTQLSFEVTGDEDYVVAYGILGDAVKYTVNFLDTEGNALQPSKEYYGNVGDKAVVAYLYIDGYRPQAYNLGITLDADPANNVINFIYTRITNEVIQIPGEQAPQYPDAEDGGTIVIDQGVITLEGTNFDTVNPATQVPGGVIDLGVQDGGEGGGNAGGGGGAGAGGGAGGGGNAEGQDIGDNQTPGNNAPADYSDVPENETPLGGGFIQGDGSKENPLRIEIGALKIPLSTNLFIGTVSVIAIIIGLSLLLTELIRRKKEDE